MSPYRPACSATPLPHATNSELVLSLLPPPTAWAISTFLSALSIFALSLSLFFSFRRALGKRCTSGNAIAGVSLRTHIPALNWLRGYLATPSQIPTILARTCSIFSLRRCSFFFIASAASSAKASRQKSRKGGSTREIRNPLSNRASRNQAPPRSKRRFPQRSSHARAYQQRTRRSPIRSPQFRLQPLFRIRRNSPRPHHASQRRHRRHPPQRHHRQSQSRRRQCPSLPGGPRQIRPYPRPRARR